MTSTAKQGRNIVAALAMLALGGLVLASGPAGAAVLTGPDDPNIPPCADFANMKQASYSGQSQQGIGDPGSLTNPAKFEFTAAVWSDVNADVDGSGNPKCGAVGYTLNVYDTDPVGTPINLVASTTFQSNQGTSPQTTFTYSYTWCPVGSLPACTFQTAPPKKVAYYVTTISLKKDRTLDRAPDLNDPSWHGFVIADLGSSPGGTFY